MDNLDAVKTRILSRVPIAELIGESVELTTRSGRPIGKCPFHDDSTPSFTIYNNRYHCFGCKAGGDAIEFVRKTKGMEFFDALRFLAEKYGIDAPELARTSKSMWHQKKSSSVYQMLAESQDFFVQQLKDPRGGGARDYLRSRGFTDESIVDFGFGMTPPEHFGLLKHLRNKRFKEEDMVAHSLATRSTRTGKSFDFFRNRLMIPIRDVTGRTIAFGGRTLDGHQAKYMNSRDTDLFDKSRTLFGLDRAKDFGRKKSRFVIVEGYMDTLQLWLQGFNETVACLGTALTEWHLKSLRNLVGETILLFDGDTAGKKATLNAVSVALTVPTVRIRAAVLPKGEDPDSFVQSQGKEALEQVLANSKDLLDWTISERISSTHSLGLPELVTKEFIPWLAQIPDRVQRSFLVNKVSSRTGVSVDQLNRELAESFRSRTHQQVRKFKEDEPPHQEQSGAETNTPTPVPPAVISELMGHIFYLQAGELNPRKLFVMLKDLVDWHPIWWGLVQDWLKTLQSGQEPASLEAQTTDTVMRQFDAALRGKRQIFQDVDHVQAIIKIMTHLKGQQMDKLLKSLNLQLRQTEDRDEQVQVLSLIKQYNQELKDKAWFQTEMVQGESPSP